MKRKDFIFSILMHLVVATAIIVPFPGPSRIKGDVIAVQIIQGDPTQAITPQAITPQTPQVVEEEPVDIPVTKPTSHEEAEIIKEEPEPPKEEPKPEEPPPNEMKKPEMPTKIPEEAPAGEEERTGTGVEQQGTEVDVPATGGGSPFGSVRVDNASFNYSFWFNLAFNKIAQNFRNPINTDARLICTINFKVIRSGRMVDARIVESSGVKAFDEACLAAVEKSAPFPALPSDFRDEVIGITVPFANK